MANIGSVIQIGNRNYRIGRLGDLRLGHRIMIGYQSTSNSSIIHRIMNPSEMKNGKMRQAWQPAFGTIVSMKKHQKWAGFRIAEITGIPGEVIISAQGRCLHEVEIVDLFDAEENVEMAS